MEYTKEKMLSLLGFGPEEYTWDKYLPLFKKIWESFSTPKSIYDISLTKEEAEYLFENYKELISSYIKYENLIYLRTTEGLKYDPLNFEDSLNGIVKF